MGTGITTGPYSITAGQTLALNDPATWSIASATVQIQNNTGYTVFVQSAGAGYNVQPFTVSTIPCAGGQTLVAVVSSTINVPVGYLTAVWLLPGQTGPMQDGPMTVFPKSTISLTVSQTGSYPSNYWIITGMNQTYTNLTVYWINSWTTYNAARPYAWLGNNSTTVAVPGCVGQLAPTATTNNSVTFTGLNLLGVPYINFNSGSSSNTIDYAYGLTVYAASQTSQE